MKKYADILPTERDARGIHLIRDQKVLLDSDLAELYGVPTKVLIQAVKRNLDRFPKDFMFHLAPQELAILRSQFVTSSSGHGGRRARPYVFTEQGVAMFSSVLKSERAVQINIAIMRAFIKLREAMDTNRELARKFANLETPAGGHDEQISQIIEAVCQLIELRFLSNQRIRSKPLKKFLPGLTMSRLGIPSIQMDTDALKKCYTN